MTIIDVQIMYWQCECFEFTALAFKYVILMQVGGCVVYLSVLCCV